MFSKVYIVVITFYTNVSLYYKSIYSFAVKNKNNT